MKTALLNTFLFFSLVITIRGNAQVVAAPDLNCVSVDNSGNNILQWSLPVVTCGPFTAFNIYRSFSFSGPYSIAYTVTNPAQTSYTDPVGNGGTTTYYYYMVSDYNCPGFTFAFSDTLDNLDPVPPEINYVTVTDGLAEINWQPGDSPESFGYIIYRVINGNYIPIDTVYGKFNNDYVDVNSTPGTDSMSYTLATIDSCINTGSINESPQHTIYLFDSIARCEQQITLGWYFYDRWQKGIQKYDIEMSTNGAPYVILQSVPGSVLSYTVDGFNDRDSICFRIVATENITGFVSVSNELCHIINVVQPVADFYIRNVTVTSPGKVLVKYSLDSLSDVSSLKIERGTDKTSFTQLANISPPFIFSAISQYTDATALTDEKSYYYRLIATDSCGTFDTSTIGKSILLKGYAFTDLTFFITWDESYFDSAEVLEYDVYRKDEVAYNLINAFLPATSSYEEKNVPVDTPCYYVEAIDSMKFSNGIRDTIHSRSNIVCLNQPSEVYIPNAFAPLGKNSSFRPLLNLQGLKSYSFSVYNRWGEQLFFSENASDSWDGKYKGVYVQQGAYAYIVDVVDENGKAIHKQGMVMVVR